MKVSLLGYNRKETDHYFSFLNQSNTELTEEVNTLKKTVDELKQSLALQEETGRQKQQELESLRQQLEDYRRAEVDYRQQIEVLTEDLRGKTAEAENGNLGIIFAVAYRDMENKNKAVSAKIREYANQMFARMSQYRNEVSQIVDSVTAMQSQQRQALLDLCNDAAKRLDRLEEASQRTIQDMDHIEHDQDSILHEIDTMVNKTIQTDALDPERLPDGLSSQA